MRILKTLIDRIRGRSRGEDVLRAAEAIVGAKSWRLDLLREAEQYATAGALRALSRLNAGGGAA